MMGNGNMNMGMMHNNMNTGMMGNGKMNMGMMNNKDAKYTGGIASVANGWATNTSYYKSHHDH